MTTNVQIVTYNRKYQLDLSNFSVPVLPTWTDSNTEEIVNLEKAIIKKIFYSKFDGDDITGIDTTVASYNIAFGVGKGDPSDTSDIDKCVFGIVSNVKLVKASDTTKVIMELEPDDFYLFIYAYRKAVQANESLNIKGVEEKNILRVHKIIKIPNTKFITDLSLNDDSDLSYGLFCQNNCIVGICKQDSTSNAEFFLPSNSYCLEGRTQNILNLGDKYKGKFTLDSFRYNQFTSN